MEERSSVSDHVPQHREIQEVPLVKFRDNVFTKKFGTSPYDYDRVQVEFFSNEKSFKERLKLYFIKNQKSSLRFRTFNLIVRLLMCLLYVIRVNYDDSLSKGTFELPHPSLIKLSPNCWNRSTNKSYKQTAEDFRINPCINWDAIFYVKTYFSLWIAQIFCAILCYTQTLLMTYLAYKGNIIQSITHISFVLDTYTSIVLIATIFYKPLRYVFIPFFLNCWLARRQLENAFNDLHRAIQKSHSALAHRLMVLAVTMFCLVFTGASAIQHFQRGGNKQINLFESFWYIIVTFSTVGYGDIYPDIWPSQLFMIVLIITVLVVLPSQFEQLALIYMEKQKRGISYSRHRAENEKHVVVCSSTLQPNIIMDFLNEFYAHPILQNYYVVLLSPFDLDPNLAIILQVPLWSQRVIYLQGSALNNSDLNRAQIEKAEACFILADRHNKDRYAADQHSILRSWAIKDYAPHCVQYIHMLKPENKMHVQHARYIVEDEFKYALLANNCLCPGLSTFMTLLLHTSRGNEGNSSNEEWQRLYGKCSGNEIYHIKLSDSKVFKEYVDKSFTYASFYAHRKFGVGLIGVQSENDSIKLNPGPNYVMKSTDICFYMSITKEENSSFTFEANNMLNEEEISLTGQLTRKLSFRRVSSIKLANNSAVFIEKSKTKPSSLLHPNKYTIAISEANSSTCDTNDKSPTTPTTPTEKEPEDQLEQKDYVLGVPPIPPYVGCSSTICHLVAKPPKLCCLKLNHPCEHSSGKQISDYNWENKVIILAAKCSNLAMYNFLVPLRSNSIEKNLLHPILFLLENEPKESFLEVIKFFPMVYWMKGSIECLEDLLKAGINDAEYLILVNKEKKNETEKAMEDCNTILAVQYIFRMFPKVKVCSEIVDSNNMRFMQFRANDQFSLQISKREKIEYEKGSQIAYMFRIPFASGYVFSAEMLDTLLYQSFVKSYLITFVRLMLGIEQSPGSGHLASMKITHEDAWIKTYGRLYQNLCSTTCEIPIGIYRTDPIPLEKDRQNSKEHKEYGPKHSLKRLSNLTNKEIEEIVKTRMVNLGIGNKEFKISDDKLEFSYVIINPNYDLNLKVNDIILIIRPDKLAKQ